MGNQTKRHFQKRTITMTKELQCKHSKYDIAKDIIIPSIGIVATSVIAIFTIMVYVKANKLSEEANIINRKNEPLLYHIVEGSEIESYEFEYNGKTLEIPYKAHALKIDQGIIDDIKIIIYDGKYFSIYDKMDYDFMEKLRTNNYTIEIGTPGKEFTQIYNDIVYDYFFIYVKCGDGKERVDLAYTGINFADGTTTEPQIENKISILKLSDEYKKDLAYYEMLEVYKDLQDKFSELLKIDIDI